MRFQITAAAAIFAGLAAAAPQATTTYACNPAHAYPNGAECVSSAGSLTLVTPVPSSADAAAAAQITSTIMVTDEITITSCAETVTDCPARTSTTSYAVVQTYPASAAQASGYAPASGSGNAGAAYGTGSATYHMPSATGYQSTFTGAANSLNAGAALAGVGAIAAFIL